MIDETQEYVATCVAEPGTLEGVLNFLGVGPDQIPKPLPLDLMFTHRPQRATGANSPEEAHAEAMELGARCHECPLYASKNGPVPSDISSSSKLVVIGEAPSTADVEQGQNLTGRPGQILDMALDKGKIHRHEVSITNATLCSPVGSKGNMKIFLQRQGIKHNKAQREESADAKADKRKVVKLSRALTPQQACLPRLRRELSEAGGKVILALGSYALKSTGAAYKIPVGKARLEVRGEVRMAELDKQAGHPFELQEVEFKGGTLPSRTFCAAQHPLVVLRGDPSASKMVLDHMSLATRVAEAGGWEWPPAQEVLVPWVKEHVREYEETVWSTEKPGAWARRKKKARAKGKVTKPFQPKPKQVTMEERWATYEQPEEFLPKFREYVETWLAAGCPNPTVDIETEGIKWFSRVRCIGFGYGPKWAEKIIVVPLRFKSGKIYWKESTHKREIKALLRTMMNSAVLGGQNFIFDSRHLIRLGLMDDDPIKRTLWFDTMLAYKNTREGNLRRGLDAITTRFGVGGNGPNGLPLAVRLWKGDVDHKASDNIRKDGDLWWYCHEDVLTQHRIRKPALEWVKRDKTVPQFKEDLRLQPILRNMGDLGVLVHEKTRLTNAEFLEKRIAVQQARVQAVVGNSKFNPNAPMQVAEWLYETQGLDPLMNTNSKRWKEGDGMATSIPALMGLQDAYPEDLYPVLHMFVDAQIKYKSMNKLLSGFVETLTQHDFSKDFLEYRILHANFKTSILSGRYGCSPNLMNWPKRSILNMRQMIHAAPGHVLVSADLDQAELRALIIAAGDPMLEQAIKEGKDPHTLNAASLMAKTEDELYSTYDLLMKWLELKVYRPSGSDSDRQVQAWLQTSDGQKYTKASNARMVAKIFFFAAAYGAWPDTLYTHMKTFRDKASGERIFSKYSKDDNKRNHDLFHKWHPSFNGWHERKNQEASLKGWIQDLWRFRKIPFVFGVESANDPPNQEIQTSIATQMNRAIQRIADLIPHRGASKHTGVLIQVHDELVVQVLESEVDKSTRILENEMPATLGGRMRIGCEAGASRIWTGKSYLPGEAIR
ncbi:MAG: hypothetical protein JKY94_16700 [Rhodobacteraceae bacterium]|nr:hypothetical protein [Paracoccaceae bacterium]